MVLLKQVATLDLDGKWMDMAFFQGWNLLCPSCISLSGPVCPATQQLVCPSVLPSVLTNVVSFLCWNQLCPSCQSGPGFLAPGILYVCHSIPSVHPPYRCCSQYSVKVITTLLHVWSLITL